jgi:hypothetical protein
MLSRRYQNSVCKNGYLHDFLQVQETDQGFLERCKRCGKQMHFKGNVSNAYYLSYHIKSALQAHDPLYEREYGKR